MKKIISLLCCVVFALSLVCLSACDSATEETTIPVPTDEAVSDNGVENADVIITMAADVTEVAPGEEFIITGTVKKSELFAAGDLTFSYDKEQLTAEFVEENVQPRYSFSNEIKSGYQYSAYVASTVNLEDALLFTVYCVADESCKSGDEIEITLSCDEWLIGVDEKGDEVKSIKDNVATNSLLIKVK